ncbi:hypothetical protein BJ138DRAFT_74225 [Hygrophoropsis aurantiaca]|uniref:Uncharacterized protein n=1 Tax=Hygrophoropsis aurantiaca TaxID=72124 RepID=A0ACB7ZRP3_9AGAM|nr:hypothetical protein BJ138DRAFT_74225 [Hygrophoropsis aurantiaca]
MSLRGTMSTAEYHITSYIRARSPVLDALEVWLNVLEVRNVDIDHIFTDFVYAQPRRHGKRDNEPEGNVAPMLISDHVSGSIVNFHGYQHTTDDLNKKHNAQLLTSESISEKGPLHV